MQQTYVNPEYPYRTPTELQTGARGHYPVVIVGAGPGGLALALDLAQQGIETLLLDDNNTVSVGSRAICFAKRTLEIMNRLGCGERMVNKGVTWKQGRVFFRDEEVFDFNLLPEDGHKMPAFINLQQYYFEEYLVDQVVQYSQIDLRWKNRVVDVQSHPDHNKLKVQTPEGEYEVSCDYVLAADGANSKIRGMLGLESKGQVFQDRFLIADVVMKAEFPTERWFWFDPPFHPNQSALLHRQADNVWRIDLQLGWDADPEEEKKEANIRPRLEAMLGKDAQFDLEWASVYTFQCRKMDNFIHNRVIFVGDAAHQVSPFGARGANGCIQSVDNLSWKLARVLKGQAPQALLHTYNEERQWGAVENIANSTRATDFITPKNAISRVFRDQTLKLAKHYPFARTMVNSGRLSAPCVYQGSSLNTPDTEVFNCHLTPGAVALDAPILAAGEASWLIEHLGGRFVLLLQPDNGDSRGESLRQLIAQLSHHPDLTVLVLQGDEPCLALEGATFIRDPEDKVRQRYDLKPGSGYLFRPDQVVAARWRQIEATAVIDAQQKALGFPSEIYA